MQKPERRGVVEPPHIDPHVGVSNPAALRYAQAAMQRAGLTKRSEPRGGDALPPMPRLDQPAVQGATIAQHAAPRQAPPAPLGGIFEPEQLSGGFMPAPHTPPAAALNRPSAGIQQGDTLPESARQDPSFIATGQGNMVAANQPRLAYKYGVMRRGEFIPPHLVEGNKPGKLSAETLRQLEEIQAKQAQAAKSAEDAREREDTVTETGTAAARLGKDDDDDSPQPMTVEQQKKIIKQLDQFDKNAFDEAMTKDLINNDEQREFIEARLEPLDLSDLIMQGFVTQRIPVTPGVFEFTLQSYDAQTDLEVKRLITEEARGSVGNGNYYLDRYSVMIVAMGLHTLNQNKLPSHLDNDGFFDREKFLTKLGMVLRLPFHIIATIGVHYHWFDIRVRKLVTVKSLKNG